LRPARQYILERCVRELGAFSRVEPGRGEFRVPFAEDPSALRIIDTGVVDWMMRVPSSHNGGGSVCLVGAKVLPFFDTLQRPAVGALMNGSSDRSSRTTTGSTAWLDLRLQFRCKASFFLEQTFLSGPAKGGSALRNCSARKETELCEEQGLQVRGPFVTCHECRTPTY
jgi:hypothetical protein